MSSHPLRKFTDFTKQCKLQYILLIILINVSYGLTPNVWYNFSATTKEYLYHDECLVLTQEAAENTCKNTHNGDNVASIATVEARDWFLNTLITSQPSNGVDACSTYNTVSSPGFDRYILFGGTFIADGAAKAEAGGLAWWNGDTYDPSLIPWALNNPNTAAWLEPAIILAFKEKAMYDQAFGGRSYAVLCERTLPTSYPTIDPTYNPSVNPVTAPTNSNSNRSTTSHVEYIDDKTIIYINISLNSSYIDIDRVITRLNKSVSEYLVAMNIDYDLQFDIINTKINNNVIIITIVIMICNLDGSIIDDFDLEQKIKDDLSKELDGDKNINTKPTVKYNDSYTNEITNMQLLLICAGIVFMLVIILAVIRCQIQKRKYKKNEKVHINVAKIMSPIIVLKTIKKQDVKIRNKHELAEQSVSDEMYINNDVDTTTKAMESSSSDEDILKVETIEGDKIMHQERKNKRNTEMGQTTTTHINGDV